MSQIMKMSKRQPDLLTQSGISSEKTREMEANANKKIIDAPLPTLKPVPHPLQSETSMRPTLEKVVEMRRAIGGTAQAEKFIEELASAAQFNRGPPGASNSSRLHFDLLLGRDDKIGYGDFINYDNRF